MCILCSLNSRERRKAFCFSLNPSSSSQVALNAAYGYIHLLFTAADVLHLCRELGRQQCVIELNTPSMTAAQMEALEQSVNEKIRERIPVTVRELAADDPEVETVSDGNEGSW